MEIKRTKFQGVLNILSFNRHFYVIGLGALLLLYVSRFIFTWSPMAFAIIVIAFLYGLIMPLIVSAWVYDFSRFYEFQWLKQQISGDEKVNRIVNINAGFDETSFIIKHEFPNSDLQVFDFYNARQHTEPAIVRARKVSMVFPNTQTIASNVIPVSDASIDLVFLLSAVHEIRSQEEKIGFLKECRRICKPQGRVIMVEHLRDFPNFLAFSVGFTHFFSRATWKNAFERAGFATFQETKFTPFMSVFNCNP
jgi:SAM-dependent methyltransferase